MQRIRRVSFGALYHEIAAAATNLAAAASAANVATAAAKVSAAKVAAAPE